MQSRQASSSLSHPLRLLVHLLIGGFQFEFQLSDVQLQLSVSLVDLVQLALHLTKRASIGQSVNLNESYNTYTEYTKHDLGTPLSMA